MEAHAGGQEESVRFTSGAHASKRGGRALPSGGISQDRRKAGGPLRGADRPPEVTGPPSIARRAGAGRFDLR
jgi:hypothetical protein